MVHNGKSADHIRNGWIIFETCMILLLAILIVVQSDVLGVTGGHVEEEMRKSMQIDERWEAARSELKNICALLLYSPEQDDYTYAVYLNKNGFSFGYFFREGGQDPYIQEGVQEIVYEDKGAVLLSMNQPGVSRIAIGSGEEEQIIEVDPQKPFAVALPAGGLDIVLYDAQGNPVEDVLYDRYTG